MINYTTTVNQSRSRPTRPLKLVGPGRQTGATLESSAAGLNPDPGTSDKSAPDPN